MVWHYMKLSHELIFFVVKNASSTGQILNFSNMYILLYEISMHVNRVLTNMYQPDTNKLNVML